MKNGILIASISCLLITGCASQNGEPNPFVEGVKSTAKTVGSSMGSLFKGYENGVFVSDEQIAKVKKGKTTDDQIIQLFGYPTDKEQLSKKQIWKYAYTKIPHFGSNINQTVIVEFKKGVVVTAYKSQGRTSSTGNPLVDAANGV